jgi:hypothetical protein
MKWTEDEWFDVRSLLSSGWLVGEGYNESAYRRLLERYSTEEVLDTLNEMVGRTKSAYVPKVSEIVGALLAARSSVTSGETPVSATVLAKRAWMDELDRRKTERRDKELEDWAAAHPEGMKGGREWLEERGFNVPDFMEEVFD